jgi:hypothetical protein
MDQNHFSEANIHSVSYEIRHSLWNPKFSYPTHKDPP